VLTDNIKKIIQNAYSHILESKKIKPRYGQKLMIADIARILGKPAQVQVKQLLILLLHCQ